MSRYRRCRQAFLAGALLVTLTLAALPAAAADANTRSARPPALSVTLSVTNCAPAFEQALRHIMTIELGSLLVTDPEAALSAHDQLAIACEVENARVTAVAARGGEVVRSSLRFDAFPEDAAPRAVALSALEALGAVNPALSERLSEQRRAQAQAVAHRAGPEPRVTTFETRAPRDRRSHLTLGLALRDFLAPHGVVATGGRLEWGTRAWAGWGIGVDVESASGQRSVSLGELRARFLSSGAWFDLRAQGSALSASLGLGARVGMVLLDGTPSGDAAVRGHEVLRWWSGPLAQARLATGLGPFSASGVAEAGVAIGGSEGLANGAAALAARGGWLCFSLNAGIRF